MNDYSLTLMSTIASFFDGKMGWAILLLALAVRLVLLPLTLHLARRMLANQRKMQALQPQVEALKHSHKHDPQAMFAATSALYKQHGVQLFDRASMLGALVQLPVFGLLYKTISNASAAGGSFLWIRNLASFDAALAAVVLVVTGLAAYYFPSASGAPATLMVALQIGIAAFIMWKLSAGLGLYWAASSGVNLLQTVVLRREQQRAGRSASSAAPK